MTDEEASRLLGLNPTRDLRAGPAAGALSLAEDAALRGTAEETEGRRLLRQLKGFDKAFRARFGRRPDPSTDDMAPVRDGYARLRELLASGAPPRGSGERRRYIERRRAAWTAPSRLEAALQRFVRGPGGIRPQTVWRNEREVRRRIARSGPFPVALHLMFHFKGCGANEARDEVRDLVEWIEHHLIVGVGHFYLFDNACSPVAKRALLPYVREGVVTYHDFCFLRKAGLGASFEKPAFYSQTFVAQRYGFDGTAAAAAEFEWIGFLDSDEFILFSTRRADGSTPGREKAPREGPLRAGSLYRGPLIYENVLRARPPVPTAPMHGLDPEFQSSGRTRSGAEAGAGGREPWALLRMPGRYFGSSGRCRRPSRPPLQGPGAVSASGLAALDAAAATTLEAYVHRARLCHNFKNLVHAAALPPPSSGAVQRRSHGVKLAEPEGIARRLEAWRARWPDQRSWDEADGSVEGGDVRGLHVNHYYSKSLEDYLRRPPNAAEVSGGTGVRRSSYADWVSKNRRGPRASSSTFGGSLNAVRDATALDCCPGLVAELRRRVERRMAVWEAAAAGAPPPRCYEGTDRGAESAILRCEASDAPSAANAESEEAQDDCTMPTPDNGYDGPTDWFRFRWLH
jgi:hypothetical protein